MYAALTDSEARDILSRTKFLPFLGNWSSLEGGTALVSGGGDDAFVVITTLGVVIYREGETVYDSRLPNP